MEVYVESPTAGVEFEINQVKEEVRALVSNINEARDAIKKLTSNQQRVSKQVGSVAESFSGVFGKENNGDYLGVYVERFNTTFNVYWKQLEDAAEYCVEVYKNVVSRWYKLTEIHVSRNDGYAAITNLVGDGYVFRVIARGRDGEEVAKSAGMVIGTEIAK
ncbi:MAG: hypothetical protein J6C23_09410 [Clostridia bacterium]|nr:hypothetical protein [Clostridia bacterium]